MVNDSILVNSTSILQNMPIKPETFIIVIGALFVLSLIIGIGFLLWAKLK